MKIDEAQQDYARDCFRDALLAIAARTSTVDGSQIRIRKEIIEEACALARVCVEKAQSIRTDGVL